MSMVTYRAQVFEIIADQLDTIVIPSANVEVTLGVVDPFEGERASQAPKVFLQLYTDPESINPGISYHKNLERSINVNVHASLNGILSDFSKLGISRVPTNRDKPQFSAETVAAYILEVLFSDTLHDNFKTIHTTIDNVSSLFVGSMPLEFGTLVEVIYKITVTGLSID